MILHITVVQYVMHTILQNTLSKHGKGYLGVFVKSIDIAPRIRALYTMHKRFCRSVCTKQLRPGPTIFSKNSLYGTGSYIHPLLLLKVHGKNNVITINFF